MFHQKLRAPLSRTTDAAAARQCAFIPSDNDSWRAVAAFARENGTPVRLLRQADKGDASLEGHGVPTLVHPTTEDLAVRTVQLLLRWRVAAGGPVFPACEGGAVLFLQHLRQRVG